MKKDRILKQAPDSLLKKVASVLPLFNGDAINGINLKIDFFQK